MIFHDEHSYSPDEHPRHHPAVQVYDWKERVTWDPDTCSCVLIQFVELVRCVGWEHTPLGTRLESDRWVKHDIGSDGTLVLKVPHFQTVSFTRDGEITHDERHPAGTPVRQPGAIMKAVIETPCEGHKDFDGYLRSNTLTADCRCGWTRTYAPEAVDERGGKLIHGTCMKRVCPGHQAGIDAGEFERHEIPRIIAETVRPERERELSLDERIAALEKKLGEG